MNNKILENFPQTKNTVNGRPLVYLDSAATTLKAKNVIQRLSDFYLYESANVHRGAHKLSDEATFHFEQSRELIREFINAHNANEIVFTRGTTEAINLLAFTLKKQLKSGDKILITELEHHSNIVPWQMILAEVPGLQLEYVKITPNGDLDLIDLDKKLDKQTKILSFTACSNVLGTLNPVKLICQKAKHVGAKTIVDAAQWVAARPTNVRDWGCDFLVFSGHKMFAPFGIGVLYGREDLLNSLSPYQGGGSMIDQVEKQKSTYLNSPQRFEAGTPNVGGAIALAEAIKFISSIGFDLIEKHEKTLIDETLDRMQEVEGLKVIGKPQLRSNILSFSLQGAHHSDVGTLLDKQGVAIRAGHHCCQILMKALGVTGTARVAFSIYSTHKDVENLIMGLKKIRELI
ncbi:MAG: SufS family cysteine desulfurase [Bdellovibrionaceae bacterium]|nr:SufS family cysteine desulfurase [Pseudobdellovibrionaceae bacterium]